MNIRRLLSTSVPIVALAAVLASTRALPGQEKTLSSSTRSFRLDGRRFLVDGTFAGDAVLLSRLTKTMGISAPLELLDDKSASGIDLPVSVLLHEETDGRGCGPIPLPECFRPLRTLELEGGTGSVGIVLGTIPRGRGAVRKSLSNSGWEWIETAGGGRGPALLAHYAKGSESFVAILDETEGKFLFFRRLER